jgi:hypothetical protein
MLTPDGTLVAQRRLAGGGTRPQTTWRQGEPIADRHGLWIPSGTVGPLTIKAGLYDPATGARWRLSDGQDSVTLGQVEVLGAVRTPPNP